jgi:homoserine O-acetyltransferase
MANAKSKDLTLLSSRDQSKGGFIMGRSKLTQALIAVAVFIMASGICMAHKADDPAHQAYLIGDLKLESGQVIRDFSISFVTHGKLNREKSNAILVAASYMGNHHRIDFLIGPGKALDTNRYFIIATDAIGNGLTTSPSNSKMQPGMKFPRFSLRDIVQSQYKLVTEHFGIRHLVAVAGASMGGMQALQWAVSHPDFMDAVVGLTPSGRCPAWTVGVMDVTIRTIMLDPAWNNGAYSSNPEKAARLRSDIILSLAASTPEAAKKPYRDNPKEFLTAMKKMQDATIGFDANNSIYQAWAIIDHNVGDTPGFGGDYYRALKSIKAKTILLTAPLDILVPADEAVEAAKYIPGAVYVQIPSIEGHFAATAKVPEDVNFMNTRISEFLKKLEK